MLLIYYMPFKYIKQPRSFSKEMKIAVLGEGDEHQKSASSVSTSKSKKICAKMNELRSLLTCTGSTQKL